MNEKLKDKANETIGPLHRVSFSYVSGVELRSGTLIVPAATNADAETYALRYLETRGRKNARITNVKPY